MPSLPLSKAPAQDRQRAETASRLELGVMLLPYLLGVLAMVAVPALLSFALSLTHFDGITPPRWAGLRNFQIWWIDPLERVALFNSLYFTVLAVPLRVLAAAGLALLLSQRGRGQNLYRAAVYVPTVVPDVAYALVILWIFNPLYGPVNVTLRALGLPQPLWLASTDTAKLVFVFMSVFQMGEGFVMLLAGLRSIPAEVYAAAAVDGATPWQLTRHVVLPLLAPWLVLLTYRDVILSFQYPFAPTLLMTQGDPYHATLFLPNLIYEEAFDRLRYGIGAAIMLVMFLASGLLVAALAVVLRRWWRADDARPA